MHILFDLDGTLTDPYAGISRCVRFALERLALPVPEAQTLRAWIGPPLLDSFQNLTGCPLLADQAVALYRQRFATVGLYENRVYPGIERCLQVLRAADHTLHVATSKPETFARRIVGHSGLAPYFTSVHGSHLDGTRAGKPALLRHVMDVQGLAAASTLMVGDRGLDVTGAHANGLFCVGALWGYGSVQELGGAEALCARPAELPVAVADAGARDLTKNG